MGNEDVYHKFFRRQERQLDKGHARVLLVTEDTKSSLYYLRALWGHLAALNVSIYKSVEIIHGKGSSPNKVLDTADEISDQAVVQGEPFDFVFCVMDVDKHPTLSDTLSKIRGSKKKNKGYRDIISNPCFEYWLFLHFFDKNPPFQNKGKNKSICDCVVDELKIVPEFKQYRKGNKKNFEESLFEVKTINEAMKRAKRFLDNKNPEDVNPSTEFHTLIEVLRRHADGKSFKEIL